MKRDRFLAVLTAALFVATSAAAQPPPAGAHLNLDDRAAATDFMQDIEIEEEPEGEARAQLSRCKELSRQQDFDGLEACAKKLLRLSPTSPQANLLLSLLALRAQRFQSARRYLEVAHDNGLPEPKYARQRERISHWSALATPTPEEKPTEDDAAAKLGARCGELTAEAGLAVGLVIVLIYAFRRRPPRPPPSNPFIPRR